MTSMDRDLVPVFVVVAIAVAFVAVLVVYSRKQNAKMREVLLPILTAAGWSDLTPVFFAGAGLRGTWRTLPVELAYFARYKSTPARFILRVHVRASSRLVIKRRMRGWLARSFTINRGLRGEVDRLLAPEKLRARGIVSEPYVTRLLGEHRSGRANHARPLWSLVMLHYWLDRWAA